MQIRNLMTDHAEWIEATTSIRDAARIMRDKGIGCLPVGENDRLVGMVTDRDICCRAVAESLDPSGTTVRSVMTEGITWCYEDETEEDAAKHMREHNIRHLPVLSRKKRIVGVLSLGDLAFRGSKATNGEVVRLASRDSERMAKSA
ncbi:MAG: CBS domain-containing protein [Parvibaculum sp.]